MANVWKNMQYAVEYAATRAVVGLARLLPLRMLLPVGAAVGWIAYRIVGVRRATASENIRLALGEPPPRDVRDIGVRAYMNLGRSLFEFAAFRRFSGPQLRRLITMHREEVLDGALEAGKGAVLFTGHFGNWELLGAVVARLGYPIHAVVLDQRNRRVDRVIRDLRARQEIRVIPRSASLKRVLRVLSRNEFVAFLADQDAGKSGLFVEFLGRPASTHRAPARIAIRQGCPIIAGFIVRDGSGRQQAIFEGPFWPDAHKTGEAAAQELTQRFTRLLEKYVRAYPDHYLWAHRRWKTKPPATHGA